VDAVQPDGAYKLDRGVDHVLTTGAGHQRQWDIVANISEFPPAPARATASPAPCRGRRREAVDFSFQGAARTNSTRAAAR